MSDARGLLTAVATAGLAQLADALAVADRAAGPDRDVRLRARGRAYVGFALEQSARFAVMWRGARAWTAMIQRTARPGGARSPSWSRP